MSIATHINPAPGGFSNIVTSSKSSILPSKAPYVRATDTLRSTEGSVPVVDLSSADLASTKQAVYEQAQRLAKTRKSPKKLTKKSVKKNGDKKKKPAKKEKKSKKTSEKTKKNKTKKVNKKK